MRRHLPLLLAAGVLTATPAAAQLVVHDATSYASLIRQAQTALDQLNEARSQLAEARRLYDGFNTASGAGGFASALSSPALRQALPDLSAYAAAGRGDLSALGALGRAASEIRDAERLYTPQADNPRDADLDRSGDRAARDLAVARAAAQAGGDRLAGLQELTAKLDAAPNARAVLDLQARLSAEQAMIANDQMRLQSLAMAQAAEVRLQEQRERERAAAAIKRRLELFRAAAQ